MAKIEIIELKRYLHVLCKLSGKYWAKEFCWAGFKRINPAICKGLRQGQTRKLKRTQLKNGYKLERLKGD